MQKPEMPDYLPEVPETEAASLASLICIPLGYSVEAQATIIKNATNNS